MNAPKNPEHLIVELKPAIEALAWMPVEMWHLWVLWLLEKLREHTENEQAYEAFLTRLTLALVGRTETDVSEWVPRMNSDKL